MHYNVIKDKVVEMYNNHINSDEIYESDIRCGGIIRRKNAVLVEDIVELIFSDLINAHNSKLVVKTGGKLGCKRVSKNGTIKVNLDKHIVNPNNTNILNAEAKSYLDCAMISRACVNSEHLKFLNPKTNNIIVSLENSLDDNTYKFYLDNGSIDSIFFLLDGKRSSIKPIWKKEFYKPINEENLMNLIKYVDNIVLTNI